MSLIDAFNYWRPEPYKKIYTKHYLAFLVEDTRGNRKWYRVNKKIFIGIRQHQKTHNGQFPHEMEHGGAYINIPLTPYFGHNRAGIGVGKVIKIAYRVMRVDDLCIRSQFVMKKDLENSLTKSFHYMKHDFDKYSRFQIFVDLYIWRKKLKEDKNNDYQASK